MGKAVLDLNGDAMTERSRRLSDAERDDLLDRLDEAEGLELQDGVALLRGGRAPWRRHGIELHVEHPGGGLGRFAVSTHCLSSKRLTVLHLGFLHRGTPCVVHLPSVWDTFEATTGEVESCDHVSGPAHRVDIRFTDEVDLRRFLERGPALTKLTQASSDTASLSGTILHIEPEVTIREAARYLLRGTKLEVVAVETVGAALDRCAAGQPSLIFVNTEVHEWSAEKIVAALREAGVVSPVILLTGETHPAKIGRAKSAGVSSVIELPTSEDRLIEAIRPWLPTGPAGEVQALSSTLPETPEAQQMLRVYVDRLARWREELTARVQADDFEKVRAACMGIKATAQTAGFDVLFEAARRAVVALDASASVSESAPVILGLISTLSRVRGVGRRG